MAEGTIIELVATPGDPNELAPVYTFSDNSGKKWTISSRLYSDPPRYRVGERVTVHYLPEDTKEAELNGFFDLWGVGFVCAVAGFTQIAFAAIGMLFWKKTRSVAQDTQQRVPPLFSIRAGLRIYGQGTSARADWPFGTITLDAESLTLDAVFSSFRLNFGDIDCIQSGWFLIKIIHHATDVPSGIRISGFRLYSRLQEAIEQHQLPVRME